MRIVITSLAVLALVACGKPAEKAAEPAAENTSAPEAGAPATAPGGQLQIRGTSWQFTRKGKDTTETIAADGAYVAWAGAEHVDHGTAVTKDDKACFTSAMDQEGEVCWTTSPVEVGQAFDTTSDKGEKLTVTRIAYTDVPEAVKPK